MRTTGSEAGRGAVAWPRVPPESKQRMADRRAHAHSPAYPAAPHTQSRPRGLQLRCRWRSGGPERCTTSSRSHTAQKEQSWGVNQGLLASHPEAGTLTLPQPKSARAPRPRLGCPMQVLPSHLPAPGRVSASSGSQQRAPRLGTDSSHEFL